MRMPKEGKHKSQARDAKEEAVSLRTKLQDYADKESVENVLVSLCDMHWLQRAQVAKEYRELSDKDLLDDLTAVTDGSLHGLIRELLVDRVKADVEELVGYFQKVGAYYRELVEFFCLRTNIALSVVASEYAKSQDMAIIDELQQVEDESVKTLLLGICKGEFSEGNYMHNETIVRKDALMLAKAPRTSRWTSRDGMLHQLLQTTCHAHIRDVIYDFEEVTGENFLDTIESECTLSFLNCMETFDLVMSSTQHYLAKKLQQCMLDGNVHGLVRLFLSAAQLVNLMGIISEYEEELERDFLKDVKSVTSEPLFDVMQSIVTARKSDVPPGVPSTAAGGKHVNGNSKRPPAPSSISDRPSNPKHNAASGTDHHNSKYKFFTHGTVSPLKSFDPYRDVHDLRIALQHYDATDVEDRSDSGRNREGIVGPATGDYDIGQAMARIQKLYCPAFSHDDLNLVVQPATNDLPLIYLISSKTNHQRQVLKSVYSEVFDGNLIEEMMETVGDELDFFMAALLLKPDDFDATFLHELLEGGNESSFALLEIMCSKTVKELRAIDQQYTKKYGLRLSADMGKRFSDTSDLLMFLTELAQGKRTVGWNAERIGVENDAREMYQQFYRDTPDINYFVQVLTSRSREQLRETFRTFRRFAGIDVLTALEPLFTPEFGEAVRLLVLCIEDRVSFFAYCLNEYIQNGDVRNLIRLIVSRSEIDLVEVKAAYLGFYNIALLDDLRPLLESRSFRLMSGVVLDK